MRKGFTLIEVIVVLGIMTLLSSIIIGYTSTGRDQVALQIEKAKLAQTIVRAKSLAVSTYNLPSVPCGYGVYFDYPNNKYEIFGYSVSPCKSIATQGLLNRNDPGSYRLIQATQLPPNIKLEKSAQGPDFVFFIPPDPTTLVWFNGGNNLSGKIILNTKSQSAAVTVSNAGQITFDK